MCWWNGSRTNEEGKIKLDNLITKIKKEGKGKEYDVLIGISGGLDSTYLAYLLKRDYDLRILAVHVDTGWNSELSVKNIENLVKALDIDLILTVLRLCNMILEKCPQENTQVIDHLVTITPQLTQII